MPLPKSTPTITPRKADDALSDALRTLVAQLVAEELAKRAGVDEYASDNRPPRTSRRAFRELCASGRVAGATKEGRTWSCSREAWIAARRRAASVNDAVSDVGQAQIGEADLAANDLAAAGLRARRTV